MLLFQCLLTVAQIKAAIPHFGLQDTSVDMYLYLYTYSALYPKHLQYTPSVGCMRELLATIERVCMTLRER